MPLTAMNEGALLTDRRLIVKLREVPVEKYPAYKKFTKVVSDDHELLIALSSAETSTASYQDEIWGLPYSENAEASRAYDQAREDYQKQNRAGQISSLTDAVEIDPKFIRAWLWLGETYKYRGKTDDALRCYRKAVAIDPRLPVTYKAMGSTLLWMENFDAAIPVWRRTDQGCPRGQCWSGGPRGGASRFEA